MMQILPIDLLCLFPLKINCGHDYRKYPERIVEVNKVIGEFLDKYQI